MYLVLAEADDESAEPALDQRCDKKWVARQMAGLPESCTLGDRKGKAIFLKICAVSPGRQ
jgi:hypothetical protein